MVARYSKEEDGKDVDSMTAEELDGEIRWRPVVSRYYWMTFL